jgi:hypothetical protein
MLSRFSKRTASMWTFKRVGEPPVRGRWLTHSEQRCSLYKSMITERRWGTGASPPHAGTPPALPRHPAKPRIIDLH